MEEAETAVSTAGRAPDAARLAVWGRSRMSLRCQSPLTSRRDPRRTWSWANVREPRRNFAVRNIHGHKSHHSCSDPEC